MRKFGKFWRGREVNFGGRFWKIQRGGGSYGKSLGLVWTFSGTTHYIPQLIFRFLKLENQFLGLAEGGEKGYANPLIRYDLLTKSALPVIHPELEIWTKIF